MVWAMTSPQAAPRIVAVDIATTGVRVLVADPTVGRPPAVGHGVAPRWAVRSGRVIEPAMLEAAIRDALRATDRDPADTPAWVGMPPHEPHALETAHRRNAALVIECCQNAGLRIRDTIPAAVASALAVTTAEERDRGVGVVDLGAGPAKLVVYLDGALDRVGAGRYRGHAVVGDVALGLRTTVTAAGPIVVEHGCAMPDLVPSGEFVDVPSLHQRPNRAIDRWVIADLIHDRLEKILSDLRDRLVPADLGSQLGAGVVLTGGYGRLAGIADLAEEVFGVPVRLGVPVVAGRDDLGPQHATVVGVALHAGYGAPGMGSTSDWC